MMERSHRASVEIVAIALFNQERVYDMRRKMASDMPPKWLDVTLADRNAYRDVADAMLKEEWR